MDRQRSGILDWLWQLMVAPSRVVTLNVPLPPNEVLRRLRNENKIVQVVKSSEIIISVPIRNNQRRFLAWLDTNQASGTRLIGRMQTPYRVVFIRMAIFLFLLAMALVWLQVGRIWLGAIFLVGGIGFLLSSQYERMWGRDLKLHLDWLRRILDAEL